MTGDLPFPPLEPGPPPDPQFVVSIEQECLTTAAGSDGMDCGAGVHALFNEMYGLAPWLPGGGGFFNAYGRVYLDCGHLELAASECESPYLLAQIVEQQQMLVADAVDGLRARGIRLLLANNNHSGLLHRSSPTWGTHENYLVERRPSSFADAILPFLVTRIYAGAGGVLHPTGTYLAAVRPVFMARTAGGGTTSDRAIHSTSRDEHHMGPKPNRFRYHLILGDGHRSQFNLALQLGATALVLKAIFSDPDLAGDLRDCGLPLRSSWVYTLRRFNQLARPGKPPAVAPQVLDVQRIYLAAAERYAAAIGAAAPPWIPRLLRDWRETLDALERLDRPWLAARLDAFTKYELFQACLREGGHCWTDLKRRPELFSELALLDHSYHAFGDGNSAFSGVERAGLLDHRTHERLRPGGEAEPYVPETTTRAMARARFIREHSGEQNLLMNWSAVMDCEGQRVRTLHDPFASEFEPWRAVAGDPARRRVPRFRRRTPGAEATEVSEIVREVLGDAEAPF